MTYPIFIYGTFYICYISVVCYNPFFLLKKQSHTLPEYVLLGVYCTYYMFLFRFRVLIICMVAMVVDICSEQWVVQHVYERAASVETICVGRIRPHYATEYLTRPGQVPEVGFQIGLGFALVPNLH